MHHPFPTIAGILIAAATCLGNPPAAEDGKTKTVYLIGNSLTDNVKYDGLQRLAESRGFKHVWGRSMTPGAPIFWHWTHDPAFTQSPFGPYKKALTEYEWDVVTLQPFQSYKNELAGALNFIDLTVKKSPDVQFYIYAQWPNKGAGDWDALFTGPAIADKAAFYNNKSVRAYYAGFVPELRQARPTIKPPRLIPAGHAMYLLSQKIQAGQVPQLKSILDLYNDGVHLGNVGAYIAGLSFFSTIYQQSPVGLPVCEPYQVEEGQRGIPITPELAKILQETVWETVATHPLTGVTSDEPVKVASPILVDGVAGKGYQTLLLPAFGKHPYKWSLAGGTLPGGLELKDDGQIVGTPTTVGKSAFTVAVADAAGATAQRELSINVSADSKPTIVDEKLPAGQQGAYYNYQVKSTGGNGTITWSLPRNAQMPAGLSLEADGRVWGSPVKTGTFTISIEVLDADLTNPDRAAKKLSIDVAPADKDVLFVRQVEPKSINVDGKLDDAAWKLGTKIEKIVEGQNPPAAAFDVVTDGDTLYIAFKVDDPKVNGATTEIDQGDSVEVYIDALNNREGVYNFDDRRIVVSANPKAKPVVVGNSRSIKSAVNVTDGGYTVEISIHNMNLPLKKFLDRAIGLDVAVNDSADGKTRTARIVWRGTKDNQTDPGNFATVILPAAQEKK